MSDKCSIKKVKIVKRPTKVKFTIRKLRSQKKIECKKPSNSRVMKRKNNKIKQKAGEVPKCSCQKCPGCRTRCSGCRTRCGGAKKGQYTKASYKRVMTATPEFAKKHGEVAKGGASGYKKPKSRVARIGSKSVRPKKAIKLNKGGASGYKKSKNRQARINSKQTQPRKPVKMDSKFT